MICIAYLTLSMACDCDNADVDYEIIYISNQSNEIIYCTQNVYFPSAQMPTGLTVAGAFNYATPFSEIQLGETSRYGLLSPTSYEYDNIQIMIFKKNTWDKYSKEELIENNIYDKLYVLSFKELEAMDFKIVYTGE